MIAMTIAMQATIAWSMPSGMDDKQVQIVAKLFYFLETRPTAGAKIVIIGEAAPFPSVKAILKSMTVIEGTTQDAIGAFAAFVSSAEEARAITAINPTTLTITGNTDCVNSGACMIGIETQPKVSIFVSHAKTAGAGINFDSNFKMLIIER